MKIKFLLILLLLASVAGAEDPKEPWVQSKMYMQLISQIDGKGCYYQNQGQTCGTRAPFAGLFRRNDKEYCIIDAAKCLSFMAEEKERVVPILIQALEKNYNVDSGDGIIPIRSEIAKILGDLGDPRALPALTEILASGDPTTLSKTGKFPSGYKSPEKTSHEAVQEAIEKINNPLSE